MSYYRGVQDRGYERRRTPSRRSSVGPQSDGGEFSGSWTVTSRNPLIHIGATTATKSWYFDPKGVQQSLLSRGCRCVEESLATANFVEFFFHALERIKA